LEYNKKTIIAELAGKDSIAAIIKYAEKNKNSFILPTVVKIPSEENRYEDLFDYYKKLQGYIELKGSHMYTPLILNATKYWWDLNKSIKKINDNYKFYTPCIACHALLHLIRIPLAKQYSNKIITGERLSHNGKFKINQNKLVLNVYNDMFSYYNIKLVQPLLNIKSSNKIDLMLSEFHTQYNISQIEYMSCFLSNNFRIDSEDDLAQYNITEYCYQYLIPELNKIITNISGCDFY